jgi:hypothetical protein
MTTENLDQKRVNWLDLAKQITLKAVERDSVYTHDLCPNSYKPDEKEKKEALKRVSDLTRDLNTLTSRMQILERDGTIGAKLLLNTEPDDIVRSVLAAMVTVKFSAEAARNLKRVGDYLDLLGNRDPERCLAIRMLFREDDGILFKHIHIYPAQDLSDCRASLRERDFNRILGLKPDPSERLCEAAALTEKWSR